MRKVWHGSFKSLPSGLLLAFDFVFMAFGFWFLVSVLGAMPRRCNVYVCTVDFERYIHPRLLVGTARGAWGYRILCPPPAKKGTQNSDMRQASPHFNGRMCPPSGQGRRLPNNNCLWPSLFLARDVDGDFQSMWVVLHH